jgi:hypothetical protein
VYRRHVWERRHGVQADIVGRDVDVGRAALTTTFRRLDFALGDWDYIQEHIPGFLYTEDVRGIVAIRKGKIGSTYMFDNWTQTSCQGHHIVSDKRVLVEGMMEEVWGWMFSGTGGKRYKVIGSVASDNQPSLRLAKRIGFKELFKIESGICLGVDQVVLEMTKDDCRYA